MVEFVGDHLRADECEYPCHLKIETPQVGEGIRIFTMNGVNYPIDGLKSIKYEVSVENGRVVNLTLVYLPRCEQT